MREFIRVKFQTHLLELGSQGSNLTKAEKRAARQEKAAAWLEEVLKCLPDRRVTQIRGNLDRAQRAEHQIEIGDLPHVFRERPDLFPDAFRPGGRLHNGLLPLQDVRNESVHQLVETWSYSKGIRVLETCRDLLNACGWSDTADVANDLDETIDELRTERTTATARPDRPESEEAPAQEVPPAVQEEIAATTYAAVQQALESQQGQTTLSHGRMRAGWFVLALVIFASIAGGAAIAVLQPWLGDDTTNSSQAQLVADQTGTDTTQQTTGGGTGLPMNDPPESPQAQSVTTAEQTEQDGSQTAGATQEDSAQEQSEAAAEETSADPVQQPDEDGTGGTTNDATDSQQAQPATGAEQDGSRTPADDQGNASPEQSGGSAGQSGDADPSPDDPEPGSDGSADPPPPAAPVCTPPDDLLMNTRDDDEAINLVDVCSDTEGDDLSFEVTAVPPSGEEGIVWISDRAGRGRNKTTYIGPSNPGVAEVTVTATNSKGIRDSTSFHVTVMQGTECRGGLDDLRIQGGETHEYDLDDSCVGPNLSYSNPTSSNPSVATVNLVGSRLIVTSRHVDVASVTSIGVTVTGSDGETWRIRDVEVLVDP